MKKSFFLIAFAITLLCFSTRAWAKQENIEKIFSESFKKGIPVQIANARDKGYTIKFDSDGQVNGKPVRSGGASFTADDIWFLVGNADAFSLYSYTAGKKYAVKLESTNSGTAATMTTAEDATIFTLVKKDEDVYAISPKENVNVSFNMFGGAGKDIKLYSSEDKGSLWSFRVIDIKNPIKLNINAQTEGYLETNYQIGNIAITIENESKPSDSKGFMLDMNNLPKSITCYMPEGAAFCIVKGFECHGWNIDINGKESIKSTELSPKGAEITINISVDKENRKQYLFYSQTGEPPYRIPAIVSTANGYVFAINDYRPCGSDIGFGEVDLVMRHSIKGGKDWNGHTWSNPIKIADGVGKDAPETWLTGFGDPAVVADREKNEILVMSVCGNRVCWHGNYGAGTPENPENPNRMARMRIRFNEATQQWEATQPEEVTYDIYPLFKDKNSKAHVGSMFIGAGRIAQSSMIKVGDYYRIYCAVWAVEAGKHRHHNYVLYSDDFGDTWNLLGELGNDFNDSPAPYGNEPKCEELPDGSILLSSRKGGGRYFNVFHYKNFERAEGYWDKAVATDEVGDLKFGRNDTNGEILRIDNLLLQTVPTGDRRSDVALFYRHISDDPAEYTPEKLSKGWKKIEISDRSSAYSSLCLLPNEVGEGVNIGIYYEESPGDYSMVYAPVNLYKSIENPFLLINSLHTCPTCYKNRGEYILLIDDEF